MAEELLCFALENGTCPVGHNALDKAAEVVYTVGGFYSVLECTGWISQPECGPSVNVLRI
jgi:hypothetical protein